MKKFIFGIIVAMVVCSCSMLYYTPTTETSIKSSDIKVIVSNTKIETHRKTYGNIIVLNGFDTLYCCNNAILGHIKDYIYYDVTDENEHLNILSGSVDMFDGGLKLGGSLNFIDNNGRYNLISSGATYIVSNMVEITEEPITQTTSLMTDAKKELLETKQQLIKQEKQSQKNIETKEYIKRQYTNTKKQIEENKAQMKKLSKTSEDYKRLSEQNNMLRGKMRDIETKYYNEYGESLVYQF